MHQASDDLLLITRLAMSSEKLPQSSTTTFVGEKAKLSDEAKPLTTKQALKLMPFLPHFSPSLGSYAQLLLTK